MNNPTNEDWIFDFKVDKTKDKVDEGFIFLTNYTTTGYKNETTPISFVTLDGDKVYKKPDDGGVYIKIFTHDEYLGQVKQLPSTSTPSPLNLSSLKKSQEDFNNNSSDAGFNQFGGSYGIQEYATLDFNGENGLGVAPFMLMFYQDSVFTKSQQAKSTSLALKRDKTTEWDITKKSNYNIFCDTRAVDAVSIGGSVMGGGKSAHQKVGKNREHLNNYITNNSSEVSIPFIGFQVEADTDDSNFVWNKNDNSTPIGLFGSRFYYGQKTDEAKAFLFLHTIPWNGFLLSDVGAPKGGVFSVNEILNTFGNRAGFISAPRLWCAFVGGLLWRAEAQDDPITWKSNNGNALIPTYKNDTFTPTQEQYLTTVSDNDFQEAPMIFSYVENNHLVITNSGLGPSYKKIENVLFQLPEQVKKELKKEFFDFVGDGNGESDWLTLKEQLEIFDGNDSEWVNSFNDVLKSSDLGGGRIINTLQDELIKSVVKSNYNSKHNGKLTFDDYIIFSPYIDKELIYGISDTIAFKYNYFTELKDDSDGVKTLLGLMSEERVITNTSYKIWQAYRADSMSGGIFDFFGANLNNAVYKRDGVYVKESDLKIYIEELLLKLKPNQTSLEKKKEAEIAIFGTDNENLIKFQLYRTCKNIYDKWIAGSESIDKLIFKGGLNARNGLDKELAKKYGRNGDNLALIDSFRFVDRSFSDIGDKLYVNPIPVVDYLKDGVNSSFYDCVTNLLSENNFDFIALPSYINYGEPETLSSMFKPIATAEAFSAGTIGPSFVCVYVGQPSKQLDFNDSHYPNDGITFRCKDGGLLPTAKDFSNSVQPYENKVAVFAVNYSQQNQNIFKDIVLDQNEFSETAESLQITDDIANRGAENRKTYGGQNMYNVYSVRSYKTEVEMMGNAMIQPMMYFQLNNIPMFHGGYMITHVKHSIKPNSMSTNFTGVRIRNVITPLLNASDLYMSLLDSINGSSISSSGKKFGVGSVAPIVSTIIDNGGTNGEIVAGNIFVEDLPKINGILNLKLNSEKENKLLYVAVAPLTEMLNDWVIWMKNNGFVGNAGNYAYITSMFRDYDKQVQVKANYGSSAAEPGTSPHGWGIAIDLQFLNKSGKVIPNDANTPAYFKEATNPAIIWLYEHSYEYGWLLPVKLRDGTGLDEHWHWEYHGTSAKCLMEKNPLIYGTTVSVNQKQKDSVLNPKTPDGSRAKYANCDYVSKGGDGYDGISGSEATSLQTKLTDTELNNNQVKVKNILKAKGYSKQVVAGIMGNIQKESGFNQNALNPRDSNGLPSYGLIQWNQNTASKADVGNTVESQMYYLMKWNRFNTFIKQTSGVEYSNDAAYNFASMVEICGQCKPFTVYSKSVQFERSKFASDFMKRFNDKKDSLAW